MDVDLKFNTRWGVFSPRTIDDGTELIMKHIAVKRDDVCLDLGCGYGPIGLALAKHCDKGEVHMVDKDFVAVELANQNTKLNNISNTKAYLSDAFRQVPKDVKFDQIISNIPAKVGREQLSIILYNHSINIFRCLRNNILCPLFNFFVVAKYKFKITFNKIPQTVNSYDCNFASRL